VFCGLIEKNGFFSEKNLESGVIKHNLGAYRGKKVRIGE